ncbi:hypothetical protein KVR01_008650 [Diaporthe batatas]|uniref:uncharacterized protein n=1 Tax=Diaporthe batatas TaxID=748121 RepID=UPI001D042FCF|nr:uncharacterized protein KVR01_008650 [Diaporthe batatas]KAG8161663.1 hypothetical protein KVR01_008650 [Diaporthe batatas]
MMNPTLDVSSSLRTQMSSVASVTTLNTYRYGVGKDVLGGSLNVDAHFDRQTAQFVPRLMSRELQHIIEKYKEFYRNDKFFADLDPELCTWDQVQDQLDKAEYEYQQKGKTNIVRRAFRKDRLTRTLSPLLEGIPENDGLGILKGALIILFNAVKSRARACDKIFECFHQVPNLLRGVHEALKRFPDDQELFTRSRDLHEGLLSCLPRLIAILLHNSDQPRVQRFAKQLFGDVSADVDEILRPLTAAQDSLRVHIRRLEERRGDHMAKRIDQIYAETGWMRMQQHEGQYRILAQVAQMNEAHKTIEAINAENKSLHAENFALKLAASKTYTLNMVHQIVDEVLRNRSFNAIEMQHQEARMLPEAPPKNESVEYNLDELVVILCHESETSCHVVDLYDALGQYNAFSDKAIAQAAYLSDTSRFRHWLQGSGPHHLLVDGHCENHTTRRTSPLSVFLASLVQGLLDQPPRPAGSPSGPDVVLYFFCGRHVDDEGCLAGPQGLIRSLTTQLILSWPQESPPPDVGFLSSLLPGTVSVAEEDLEVETVCHIFLALLRQLPRRSTVYCIIDGISYFETSIGGWSEDICFIVDCLQSCSLPDTSRSDQPVVKTLLGSANRSIEVRELYSTNCIVQLRSGGLYSSVVSRGALISDLRSRASFVGPAADDDPAHGYSDADERQYWD